MTDTPDNLYAMQSAMDQMVAWYRVFSEGLANVQQTLENAGIDRETVRVIVAQQHYQVITHLGEDT